MRVRSTRQICSRNQKKAKFEGPGAVTRFRSWCLFVEYFKIKCDLFHVNHHAWCLIILLRFSLMRQPSIRCMGVPRKE
ncbi:hypothetical protein QVD17_42290 [Tagetes erecta]|uniref:Uncharacterized protein n=1 Tax=Tagetes erecta TaxID=13708 RepID=A0AAD8JK60_TARER|nr:hypothetical protein QVD17_42290 [Tagetes erecta]